MFAQFWNSFIAQLSPKRLALAKLRLAIFINFPTVS